MRDKTTIETYNVFEEGSTKVAKIQFKSKNKMLRHIGEVGIDVSDLNKIEAKLAIARNKKFKGSDFLFLDSSKLPEGYEDLKNAEKKKYYNKRVVSYSSMLKGHLKKAGIEDYWNFSPHNIRKTYGMWMRIYNKEMTELCYRMGHDIDTYMTHYGSSLIFTDYDRRKINKILGEVN